MCIRCGCIEGICVVVRGQEIPTELCVDRTWVVNV